jgi:hypothetical protein
MPRTKEITNSDDIIDSRDVIARIDELESELAAEHENLCMAEDDENADRAEGEAPVFYMTRDLEQWIAANEIDEAKELRVLRALAEEGEGFADWRHGETLIRESHFKEYAMQLADDLGCVPTNAAWPLTCIDWQQAADELQMDYSSLDFDGVTYYARS